MHISNNMSLRYHRWEGIAKHMLQWLTDMIDKNNKEQKAVGSVGELDDFIANISTRHSIPDKSSSAIWLPQQCKKLTYTKQQNM